MLRDWLVVGINNEAIQWRFLSESTLTFKTTFKLAQNLEVAVKNTREILDRATTESHAKLDGSPVLQDSSQIHKMGLLLQCSCCGDVGHSPTLYPFKGAKCHQCGKIGHIKTACRSRKSRPQESRFQRKSIREVLTEEPISAVLTEKDDSDQASIDEYALHQVTNHFSKPLEVQVKINNKCVTMELDTGAAVSQRKLFTHCSQTYIWMHQILN